MWFFFEELLSLEEEIDEQRLLVAWVGVGRNVEDDEHRKRIA